MAGHGPPRERHSGVVARRSVVIVTLANWTPGPLILALWLVSDVSHTGGGIPQCEGVRDYRGHQPGTMTLMRCRSDADVKTCPLWHTSELQGEFHQRCEGQLHQKHLDRRKNDQIGRGVRFSYRLDRPPSAFMRSQMHSPRGANTIRPRVHALSSMLHKDIENLIAIMLTFST